MYDSGEGGDRNVAGKRTRSPALDSPSTGKFPLSFRGISPGSDWPIRRGEREIEFFEVLGLIVRPISVQLSPHLSYNSYLSSGPLDRLQDEQGRETQPRVRSS